MVILCCRITVQRHHSNDTSDDHFVLVYVELGVGGNTPGIIKYPFWKLTKQNTRATYICVNDQEAYAPREISPQAICIKRDIGEVLRAVV